jgi:hypothetical protein
LSSDTIRHLSNVATMRCIGFIPALRVGRLRSGKPLTHPASHAMWPNRAAFADRTSMHAIDTDNAQR